MDILSAKVHIDPTLTGLDGMCILESESGTKQGTPCGHLELGVMRRLHAMLSNQISIHANKVIYSRSFLQVATTKEAVAPPLRVVQIEELICFLLL
ncbi:hypothetical protein L6452_42532 [Arctium lappa]|uniref:Uncharacterized protein n=1 Tax=Arctium lappa TaxID=4217 RepID=A0ACB8XJC0_ARCLA|nr:hypothetical protein L6452_42532 [Arctium lappa]